MALFEPDQTALSQALRDRVVVITGLYTINIDIDITAWL